MVEERKLKLKEDMKKKKPTFVVKESKFSARVKLRWRFPRGKHSKVRQMHRGRPALPQPGYGKPKEVRGLHKSGVEIVVVNNAAGIDALDVVKQGALIASRVSKKKKIELLELAKSKGIKVLNVKDVDTHIADIKKAFEERKELKKKKLAESSKKEEEKKKKAEEKKKKEEKEKKEEAEKKSEAEEAGKKTAVEETKTKEEKQKEMIDKTITKKQ